MTPDVHGAEIAEQPGFEGQMTLIGSEMSIKKKLIISGTVVVSLFIVGLGLGVLAGFFIF